MAEKKIRKDQIVGYYNNISFSHADCKFITNIGQITSLIRS